MNDILAQVRAEGYAEGVAAMASVDHYDPETYDEGYRDGYRRASRDQLIFLAWIIGFIFILTVVF